MDALLFAATGSLRLVTVAVFTKGPVVGGSSVMRMLRVAPGGMGNMVQNAPLLPPPQEPSADVANLPVGTRSSAFDAVAGPLFLRLTLTRSSDCDRASSSATAMETARSAGPAAASVVSAVALSFAGFVSPLTARKTRMPVCAADVGAKGWNTSGALAPAARPGAYCGLAAGFALLSHCALTKKPPTAAAPLFVTVACTSSGSPAWTDAGSGAAATPRS